MHHAISGRDPAAEAPFSFPPLQKLCPDVDSNLAGAVDQALAYDLASRVSDAAEFKFRLLRIKNDASRGSVESHGQSNYAARTQLKLPLGDPAGHSATNPPLNNQPPGSPSAAVPGLGPSGPTVLNAPADITCPECVREIPADSHFCSYCACDLRLVSPSLRRAAAANDETVLLSGGHLPENAHSRNLSTYPPLNASSGARRRNGLRRPFIVLALIFATGFIVAELIKSISRTGSPMPPGYSTGSAEGPDAVPRARAGIPPNDHSNYDEYGSALERSRLAVLRARLDAQGYSMVKFRLDGDTLVLYGSVPTDYDRLAVQAICFATVGLTSLSDDLTVARADPED